MRLRYKFCINAPNREYFIDFWWFVTFYLIQLQTNEVIDPKFFFHYSMQFSKENQMC